MTRLQVIWTALPNGFTPGGGTRKLKLSVFVSPRLAFAAGQQTGTLEAFTDFLNWPTRLSTGHLSLDVIIDNDVDHPIATEIVTKPVPDPAIWGGLFDRTTFVRGYEFTAQREPVSYYQTTALQKHLYDGFGEVGESVPYRQPDSATLKRAFPHVFAAVAPVSGVVDLYERADFATMSDGELAAAHQKIGENLLRDDERSSFAAKLARVITIAGELARRPNAKAVPIVPATDNPVSALAQFAAFHRRPARRRADASPMPADVDADRTDFHQILTALGEYPDLLRRLGLVIDLELAADLVPASVFGDARLKRLRVQPKFGDGGLANTAYTPNTKYLHDRRLTGSPLPFPIFAAAPQRAETHPASPTRDPEIVGGLLNLGMPMPAGGQQFSLVQVDIDGALTKVLNAVTTITLEEQRPTVPIDHPVQASVPAFRSSGVSLVRNDHAGVLIDGIRKAADHQAALEHWQLADFFAEDLVRGYRIDVRRFPSTFQFDAAGDTPSSTPPWMSLHRRVGNYIVRQGGTGSVTLSDIVDEGFIQPAFVQDANAGTSAAEAVSPIYVPESMFHWKGWCLSAPPPINPIDVVPSSSAAESVAASGLPQLDVEFAPVPGTLPRLRFGSFYDVRARTVDLAGNGLTIDDADNVVAALAAQGGQTPVLSDPAGKFRYRRFEPINPPEPVLREILTAGETIDVMVIRSDGSTAAAYAASLGDPAYKGVNERHIVPPKAALSLIETHGRLDGAFGGTGNPAPAYNLCRRENGTLDDNFVININTGNQDPLPNVVVTNPATGIQTTIPHGILPVALQGSIGTNKYTVHYEAQLRLPYLPDPLARGAALFGLPGLGVTTGQLDEHGELKWSDADHQVLAIPATRDLGFVTKIDFGPNERWPDFLPFRLKLDELASDAFPVKPKWSSATRELTVRLAPGQAQTIWISSYPVPEDVNLLGLHAWWTSRVAPSTDEKHFLKMAQHGALAMLSPPRKMVLVHAVQRPVKAPQELTGSPVRVVKFPNDTTAYIAGGFKIHSKSTAKLDLQAEWVEQAEGPVDTARHTINSHVFEIAVPPPPASSTQVKAIATFDAHTDQLEFQAPPGSAMPAERYLARHAFGDTKHRLVTYSVVATTRYREFFPDSITRNPDNLTRIFRKRNVVVPSSAQPPAPEISHIVPSFGWIVDRNGTQVTQSVRRGGGLRVYLGEKWYASGDGEQLAIVDDPAHSQWGFDPVHVSTSSSTASSITPDALAASAPDSPYDNRIYPYDVHFDDDQKLWYSDISFRVGDAYFPFKEIALARYQKNSLTGLHLSSLVFAGIYQLAPDRAVTLQYAATSDPNRRRVSITVSASAPIAAHGLARSLNGSPTIEVVLEEREAARQNWDESFGWNVAEASQQPVVDRPPSQSQLWIGHVLLPLHVTGGKQRRLVVREVELFPPSRSPPGQAWIDDAGGTARRIVYADTIRLD